MSLASPLKTLENQTICQPVLGAARIAALQNGQYSLLGTSALMEMER
jgi:hypothetical protein